MFQSILKVFENRWSVVDLNEKDEVFRRRNLVYTAGFIVLELADLSSIIFETFFKTRQYDRGKLMTQRTAFSSDGKEKASSYCKKTAFSA